MVFPLGRRDALWMNGNRTTIKAVCKKKKFVMHKMNTKISENRFLVLRRTQRGIKIDGTPGWRSR